MTEPRDSVDTTSLTSSDEIAQHFHAHSDSIGAGFGDGLVELSRTISLRPEANEIELATIALVAAVAAVPATCWASLTHGGSSPDTPASSDAVADVLDRLQYESGDGPCLAAVERGTVIVSDFETEQRWPEFIARARKTPVAGSTSYPLSAAGHPGYSLNFYTDVVASDEVCRATDLAAAGFSIALTAINEHIRAQHLDVALKSSRHIGAAMGILMSQRKVTDEEAFDLLRTASQNSHRKLRDIAEDVLLTGTLPEV